MYVYKLVLILLYLLCVIKVGVGGLLVVCGECYNLAVN